MICIGTSGGQFRWELQRCPPKVHQRRRRKNCEKHHQEQQWDVHSSLEVPARPPLNSPHNSPSLPPQKIETSGRFRSFTAPLDFRNRTHRRKWEIIDLVAQDTGVDTRRGGTGTGTGTGKPSYASSLRQNGSSSKKLTFVLPAGRSDEFRELQSARKNRTSIRAEGIPKERRNGHSPDYRKGPEIEDDSVEGMPDDTNIWDSNAEGIRRGGSKMRSSSKSEMPPRDRTPEERTELEYDDFDIRSRIPRNSYQKQQRQGQGPQWEFDDAEYRTRDRFREEEWDYNAEASDRNRTARSREAQAESSRWWQPNEENGSYEGETGEDPTSFQDLLSGISMNMKDAFVFIRWGLPAAVLLVPWVMSNPMTLLVGLSFIPAANKVIFPIASQIFRTVMSGGSPSKPRRKRKQNASSRRRDQAQRTSTFYEKEPPPASTYTSPSPDQEVDLFSSVATTIFGDENDDDLPRKPPRLGVRSSGTGSVPKRLGGWEDLEEDRARARSERWPADRSRSEKKIVRREQNIFIRLLVALFPFLRYWGGLM